MNSLRVLSSLALAAMLEAVRAGFESEHGIRIDATLLPTALLLPRIMAGEAAEVAILTAPGIEALVEAGLIDRSTRRDLARSRVGMAVQAGAPQPSIGTEAELVAALLAARSVALSRAGVSGIFLGRLLDRLGIAAEVQAKAVVIDSGYTAELAATGQVELALQQVSELMMVPGVDIVGPLPPGLDGESVFSGGLLRAAKAGASPAGAALLEMIAGARDMLVQHGLAPV